MLLRWGKAMDGDVRHAYIHFVRQKIDVHLAGTFLTGSHSSPSTSFIDHPSRSSILECGMFVFPDDLKLEAVGLQRLEGELLFRW